MKEVTTISGSVYLIDADEKMWCRKSTAPVRKHKDGEYVGTALAPEHEDWKPYIEVVFGLGLHIEYITDDNNFGTINSTPIDKIVQL